MDLKELLAKQADTIVERWFDAATAQYPPDTSSFIKNRQDPFHNPVGANTIKALKTITAQLLGDMDRESIKKAIDPAIRIRAVQKLSAAESVVFIFAFKSIVADLLQPQLSKSKAADDLWQQYMELNNHVDEVALIAMDVYSECREKLFSLQNHMEREGVYKAFRRAGLVQEDSDGAKIEVLSRCHDKGLAGDC